jgi:signal transduction histidine kinase
MFIGEVCMPADVSTAGVQQDIHGRLEARERELAEARQQQAATAAILGAISSCGADSSGVFEQIAASAAHLCAAYDVTIHRLAEGRLLLGAHHGPIPSGASYSLVRGMLLARAVIERRILHVPDLQKEIEEYPEGSNRARKVGFHTVLAVPLIHADEAVGVITLRRGEVRPFTDGQIALLKTFADQAVIAIENTRLFEEVQARTRELTESLEYQTAISEVLGVISQSPTNVQPVFDTIAASAERLCGAKWSVVTRFDGHLLHLEAHHNLSDVAVVESVRRLFPRPLTRGGPTDRAIISGTVSHVPDVLEDPEYTFQSFSREAGYRSHLSVPMVRDGQAIGAITVAGDSPRAFSDRQVSLLKAFADQAVIAIENARLFEAEQVSKRELQESLEYQTATSGVLNVISRSPTDVEPVFDMIAESAWQLCDAQYCFVYQFDGQLLHFVAHHGLTGDVLEINRRAYPAPPSRRSVAARAVLERCVVQIPDVTADKEYALGGLATAGGYRSAIGVPILHKGLPIGSIALTRAEGGLLPDRLIDVLKIFADQAVIAIENTRLFEAEQASKRELQESLEYQMATADVLKVISRSALDVKKVLDALVESASRLCNANDAAIFQVFGDGLRLVAHHGQIAVVGPVGQLTIPVERGSMAARAVIDRRTIQVADMLAEGHEYPESRKRALQNGHRTALAVPLVHAGEAIGVILMRRGEVRPFVERQVDLVNTFADQAVIAIENARLFEEVQSRTHELAKTIEDLEIASQHKSQFVANMSHELRTPLAAVLGYAELMQEGFYEPQGKKSLDALTRIRANGKHLLGLINTVLDIAKIESGQFSLNLAEYAIESVVETVRAATESLAETKKLALKTEVAKALPFGLGDEQRLTQVLLNLVGNAIKFTDAGEVRIAATAVNGHFNVTVTDTGPGIPEEHQARIFEQFHQVDNSNTKAKGGTGLGLAIAKQIVEMHGGRIWVESIVGKGSTFQMELPVRAIARKAAE